MNVKVGLAQLSVGADKEENLNRAINAIAKLAQDGADVVVLPEIFICPYNTATFGDYAEEDGGPSWQALSQAAKGNHVYLVAGSVVEMDEGKLYNTCYIFDRQGNQIGKHRKMHMFDINIRNGQSFKESDTLSPGNDVTVYDTEFCKMGTCICFDMRFPELARLMVLKGAKVLIVPAAFNMTTGPAHWELMFRQRAIDNQAYCIGVAPARDSNGTYVSYGNSIVISPWGDILYRMDEKEQTAVVELDLDIVEKIRHQLPLLDALRGDVYQLTELEK